MGDDEPLGGNKGVRRFLGGGPNLGESTAVWKSSSTKKTKQTQRIRTIAVIENDYVSVVCLERDPGRGCQEKVKVLLRGMLQWERQWVCLGGILRKYGERSVNDGLVFRKDLKKGTKQGSALLAGRLRAEKPRAATWLDSNSFRIEKWSNEGVVGGLDGIVVGAEKHLPIVVNGDACLGSDSLQERQRGNNPLGFRRLTD